MLNRNKLVSLQVLTEVNTVVWDVTSHSLVEVYERFGGTCYLCIVREDWKKQRPKKDHNFGQNKRHHTWKYIRQKQTSVSIWTRQMLSLYLFRP
jgi:hypothetical protein